jgi:urease accessory protein UreE
MNSYFKRRIHRQSSCRTRQIQSENTQNDQDRYLLLPKKKMLCDKDLQILEDDVMILVRSILQHLDTLASSCSYCGGNNVPKRNV